MSLSSLESHRIAVIGAGSWGTALGAWLANNGHTVRIWDVNQMVIEDINHHHQNSQYFQDIKLLNGLQGCQDSESSIGGSKIQKHCTSGIEARTGTSDSNVSGEVMLIPLENF